MVAQAGTGGGGSGGTAIALAQPRSESGQPLLGEPQGGCEAELRRSRIPLACAAVLILVVVVNSFLPPADAAADGDGDGDDDSQYPAVPHAWPQSFRATWSVSQKFGQATKWNDVQTVLYDWPNRRQRVDHTNMLGWGKGVEWRLATGQRVFVLEGPNGTSPCCQIAPKAQWASGFQPPDWMQTVDTKPAEAQTIEVFFLDHEDFPSEKWENADKTHFYWEVDGGVRTPGRTPAQWGFPRVDDADHEEHDGFWKVRKPIEPGLGTLHLSLTPTQECIDGGESLPICGQ